MMPLKRSLLRLWVPSLMAQQQVSFSTKFHFSVLISLTGTSTNYITNSQRRQQLVDHFVSYFGQTDKARCTDDGFPDYSGRSLVEAHQNMAIGFEEFATFNEIFLQTLANKSFPDNDILLFASVLNNTVVSNLFLHSFICYLLRLKITHYIHFYFYIHHALKIHCIHLCLQLSLYVICCVHSSFIFFVHSNISDPTRYFKWN